MTTRWSADDWTERALALLMSEGVGAVKITRLCTELDVTRGSFYWHFAGIGELMQAIATRWCERTEQALRELAELEHRPPLERLRGMTERLLDDQAWAVERALRDWARHDQQVADAVTESDRFIYGLVYDAFTELGFPAAGARTRAGTLVYAGIGFAHGQRALPKPTRADIKRLLALMTSPEAGA